jgi:predicted esterase YcpF (UPF0227 family)
MPELKKMRESMKEQRKLMVKEGRHKLKNSAAHFQDVVEYGKKGRGLLYSDD